MELTPSFQLKMSTSIYHTNSCPDMLSSDIALYNTIKLFVIFLSSSPSTS